MNAPEPTSPQPDRCPAVSLVIPAWNEERYLPRLLDTVDAARARYRRGPDAVEVIVADNDSTDRTSEVARERGCRVAHVSKRCIAAARNGGAAVARGEIISFVDADYRVHPETFNAIDDVMADPRYIGGGTGLTMERRSPGITMTLYALIPVLKALGLDGGVWFCRRDDFHEAGGYDERWRVSEDVRFLMALRRLGRSRRPRQRLKAGTHAKAICSTRKFDKHGDWHFPGMAARLALLQLFAPRKADAFAQRYWYEDER